MTKVALLYGFKQQYITCGVTVTLYSGEQATLNLLLLTTLQWHHNGRNSVSNYQPHDCLLNRLFRRRSKKKSKLRVTGLCAGNSPGTGEFSVQMASNAENVSIWWRHHVTDSLDCWHALPGSCIVAIYSIYKPPTNQVLSDIRMSVCRIWGDTYTNDTWTSVSTI